MKRPSFSVYATYTLLTVTAIIGCESPTDSPSVSVPVDRQVVADIFGNHDGVASSDELLALDEFFKANPEAWCVSSLSQELWQSDEASADQMKACLAAMATRPYPGEQALRQAYEGVNIRTPYVSIVVISSNNNQLQVTKFFRSFGSGVSSAHWVILNLR